MKKRNLRYIFILLVVFFVLVISSSVFANNSLINKELKNKFDPTLISYLQNKSQKITKTFPTKGVMAQTLGEDKIPVIIALYNRDNMEEVYSTLSQNGADIKFSFQLIDAIAADIPPNIFESLATNEHIKKIYLDRKIQIPTPNITLEKKIYELNRKMKVNNEGEDNRHITPKLYESTKLINAQFMWDLGVNGSGIKIAILDTGIDDTHPDLAGKVIAKRDFTLFDNELKTGDGHGHGTHVAGTAAGTGTASVKQIDTSSTDTSGLSNLPFPPNTYHVGIEEFKFWWDTESNVYNVLIVDSLPSEGDATLNSTYPDKYFDFETLSNNPNYGDINFDNYSMQIYAWGGGIIDMGETLMDSITCSEDSEDYNYYEYIYLHHTYCILTDKNNYIKIYITDNQPNHLDFSYKFQSTPEPIVFLDIDGNFDTKSDQFVASNNTRFTKSEKTCYSDYWGTWCWYDTTYEILFDIVSDLNSVKVGYDLNWDNQPDILKGVAPGADLLNGKVLSDYGGGYDSGIIAGIEWAVLSGADIISLSVGGLENICDGNDPLSEAVEKAVDRGVTVVVAAGNSGWWGRETLGSPGCADKIITVGASSKYGYDLYIADFSSQGPTADGRIKPEVLAPGMNIISPQARGTQMGYPLIQNYVSASGTSMATPHVAGAAALLKQMDSSLTPQEIKEILMNTASDLIGESVFREGAGIINMSKAYDEILNSKNLASPSMFNLILKNTETKKVQLNTTLEDAVLSAVKDELESTIAEEFSGEVNETNGFIYNFSIDEGTVLFMVSIGWNDSSNKIYMELYDPLGYYYGGSYLWGTNYQSILINNPESGIWSLRVYPWWGEVTETVDVNGYLYLKNLIPWNWFNYNDATNELTIDSNEEESGLYTGKITLESNSDSTMIPTSIIVSEPIEFSGTMTHSSILDPCNVSGSGGGGGGWSSSGSSTKSYASFDGYFCNDLQRKAYSFSIPNNAPYFNVFIDWWTPSGSTTYGDIRMFIYDPEGRLYDSIDYYGEFESVSIYNPMPGDWTVVVESEYILEEGIIFSGDVTMPSIIFDPDYIWLTLRQGEEITKIINVTNTLNYDLDFSVEKAIWQETPISVTQNSDMDNNSLGPFIYSYRYYNFNVPQEYVDGGKYLKSLISLEDSFVYRIGAYIFDADGIFVDYVYNYYSNDLSAYHYLPTSATPGKWTIVVFIEGFYSDQYPFNINLGLLDNIEWNWSQVTEPPSFFQGTKSMILDINVPQSISIEDKMATLYLSGGWWQGDPGSRTLYRSLSTMYPITITIVNGTTLQENCSSGNNIEDVNATNEYVDFYSFNTLFDNDPVPVCAKIIAKDPDGVVSGSYTIGTEGQYGLMHVYRDDAMTPSIDEGADPGDTITFYINGNPATVVSGNPTWTAKGDQKELDLSAVLTETINIELNRGWNLISIPLILTNTTIEYVLSSLGDPSHVGSSSTWDGNYSRVLGYDQGGKTFNPNLPTSFSDLRNTNEKRGYWIYMTEVDTLTVTGAPIINRNINLNVGWNLISYLSSINQTPEDALSSLGDPSHVGSSSTWDGNYSRVLGYDQGGKTFNPNLPTSFSDLRTMERYKGYWIYMIQPDILVYS